LWSALPALVTFAALSWLFPAAPRIVQLVIPALAGLAALDVLLRLWARCFRCNASLRKHIAEVIAERGNDKRMLCPHCGVHLDSRD
jgi:hypothetical protein